MQDFETANPIASKPIAAIAAAKTNRNKVPVLMIEFIGLISEQCR
jgi:hypothetical protein